MVSTLCMYGGVECEFIIYFDIHKPYATTTNTCVEHYNQNLEINNLENA